MVSFANNSFSTSEINISNSFGILNIIAIDQGEKFYNDFFIVNNCTSKGTGTLFYFQNSNMYHSCYVGNNFADSVFLIDNDVNTWVSDSIYLHNLAPKCVQLHTGSYISFSKCSFDDNETFISGAISSDCQFFVTNASTFKLSKVFCMTKYVSTSLPPSASVAPSKSGFGTLLLFVFGIFVLSFLFYIYHIKKSKILDDTS